MACPDGMPIGANGSHPMISVLLTSAGTDSAVALCEALRASFPAGLRLVGVDTRTAVACMPWLDHFTPVSPRRAPGFMDEILRLCRVHEITHVWPLSTEDQLIMALESGTRLRDQVVIASPVDVVEIANDKIRLYERCAARGVARPGVPDHRRRRGSATRRRRARASAEARRAQGRAGDRSRRPQDHRSQCRGGKQPPRGCAGTGG